MIFSGNKTESVPVPIQTLCCYHKRMSTHTHIGMLICALYSTSSYNTARMLHLHIQSQNRWTSCLFAGSDVIQISTLDGMPSDCSGFSSSTEITRLMLSGSWTQVLSSAGSILSLHPNGALQRNCWGRHLCGENERRSNRTMTGVFIMSTCKFVITHGNYIY